MLKANQKILHRQIRSQFQRKRKMPCEAKDHEIGHCRAITWTLRAKQVPDHIGVAWVGTSLIMEAKASGRRKGMSFRATHLFHIAEPTSWCGTSLRTSTQALLQLVRERWSMEGRYLIRDTQFHEDAHSYRGNGAEAVATLRTAALNLLRLAEFRSIRASMQAVMHAITAPLTLAWRQPESATC